MQWAVDEWLSLQRKMQEVVDASLQRFRRKVILAHSQDNRPTASSAKTSVAIIMFDPFLVLMAHL